jgi:hypothetical protein
MHPPRRRVPRASTSSTNNNNNSKHKEVDQDGYKRPITTPTTPNTKLFMSDKHIVGPKSTHGDSKPKMCNDNNNKCSNPSLNNTLFAGYLAHEFLTKGTMLGRQMSPMSSSNKEPQQQKYNRYVEVAHLLKSDDTHFRDIVNPTQLGRELRLS